MLWTWATSHTQNYTGHWSKQQWWSVANMSDRSYLFQRKYSTKLWNVFLFTHTWVSSDLVHLTNTYPHKQMMKHGNLAESIYLSLLFAAPSLPAGFSPLTPLDSAWASIVPSRMSLMLRVNPILPARSRCCSISSLAIIDLSTFICCE